MSIEMIVLLCSGAIALINFAASYREQKKEGKRRGAVVLSFIFVCIAGIAGFEEYWRRDALEDLPTQLERDWIVLQDTPAAAVEIELLSPDGMLTGGVLPYASRTVLQLPPSAFGPSYPMGDRLDFAQIFTPENLAQHGRLGINVSTVQTSQKDGQKTIEKIDRADCIASATITAQVLDLMKTSGKPDSGDVCAAAVAIELKSEGIRLRDIAGWPKVSLSQHIPADANCAGACQYPLLTSIRLAFNQGENLTHTAIEISPAILMTRPSSILESEHIVKYELPGDALLQLAKSYYTQSYGYRQRKSFALTKGFFHFIYRRSTTKSQTARLLDIAWTTDPQMDEQQLNFAVPPNKRATAVAIGLREWCGFGDRDVCWYRFSMLEPASD